MSGARILNDAQIDEMATLREAGRTYEQIAQRFGVSPKTIRWQCLRVGADRPDGHLLKASSQPMLMRRGGAVVRRFTDAEDAALREMREAGTPTADIARALGRRYNSILGRLMTLAMHDDRQERANG